MLLSTFKNARFKNFFLADIISGFGAGMTFMGANWFVLQETGSNKSVGILLILGLVSGLLFFPIAGIIADRFNRRFVMIASNVIRAIVILFIAGALSTGDFKIYYIYILTIIGGIGWAIFLPAARGFVQEVLTKEEYVNGSSLIEISLQVGMFTSAAACGIIYKYFGYVTILLIDVVAFFIGVYFLYRIDYQPIVAHDKESGFFSQFINGGKFLKTNPLIFIFGIVMFIPFVATMTSNVVVPGYVSKYLGADSVVFGFSDMFYGVGACLSGFIAAKIATKIDKFRAIILFFCLSIATLLYMLINSFAAGLYISMLLFGIGNSSLRVVMTSKIMEIVPKSYMGRSQSVWMTISRVLEISSIYGAGSLIDHVPVQFGFAWILIIMLMGLGGFLWIMPHFKAGFVVDEALVS